MSTSKAVALRDQVIVKLESARQALVEAKSVQEIKWVMDAAEFAKIFAQRQKLGKETVRYATEITLEAERKLGEALAATPKNAGTAGKGRPKKGGTKTVPPKNDTPTLADQGIDKKTSARAQQLANFEPRLFAVVKSGQISFDDGLTLHRANKLTREIYLRALAQDPKTDLRDVTRALNAAQRQQRKAERTNQEPKGATQTKAQPPPIDEEFERCKKLWGELSNVLDTVEQFPSPQAFFVGGYEGLFDYFEKAWPTFIAWLTEFERRMNDARQHLPKNGERAIFSRKRSQFATTGS